MKPHIRLKSIAAGVTAAVMITAISATAAADDIFNSNYKGTYHEENNSEAFVTLHENEAILVAYYYTTSSGSNGVYVRDVITTILFDPYNGSKNLSFSKSSVRTCESDGTYLDQKIQAFLSIGYLDATPKITAHGKTYRR